MNPWEEHPAIWKTQSAFMSYVRGGVRRGLWEKHPVKLQFIKDSRVRVPLGKQTEKNPEGLVWGCKCSLCDNLFRQPECQVDHKQGNHSLKSMDDLRKFVESMLFVHAADLQIVCKPCHTIKSYSEKHGISFEDARLEKLGILFEKLDKDIASTFLRHYGFKPEEVSNAKKRRQCFVKFNKGKGSIIMPKEMTP